MLPNLSRAAGERRVAPVELFFDLVYVFAVTQLSHRLLLDLSLQGALHTALLLVMVWLVWVYTTWVTNFIDPQRLPVRLMLLVLMPLSLLLSASLPQAFGSRGLVVGGAYAAMQVGRSAFSILATNGDRIHLNFQRITCWCLLSGVLAVWGGLAQGDVRAALWVGAVSVDLLGATVGFWTPGLGRSVTADWTIQGDHFAERCQAFVLIALGESVVVIGATFSDLGSVGAAQSLAFGTTFITCAALWWLYFDSSAESAAEALAASADPGRLGRSAYHGVHPLMIAGVIATAAADELVLAHPGRTVDGATAWLLLGGAALFVAGHAAFKAIIWQVVPTTRLMAVLVLVVLFVGVGHLSALALSVLAALVLVALAGSDRWQSRPSPGGPTGAGQVPDLTRGQQRAHDP